MALLSCGRLAVAQAQLRRPHPLAVRQRLSHARRVHAGCGFERLSGIVGGAVMFVFFSNKLGCLGSIVVSAIGTLLVLWLLKVF